MHECRLAEAALSQINDKQQKQMKMQKITVN